MRVASCLSRLYFFPKNFRFHRQLCKMSFTTLDEIPKLSEVYRTREFPSLDHLSFYFGDIRRIEVDAIVNAANRELRGGGGVDGAIHAAAGHELLQAECRKHNPPIATGNAVSTSGCNITHIKRIIHAVGPICRDFANNKTVLREKLISCYRRALEISVEENLRSIAFPCISTGIYGYPNGDAAFSVLRFLIDFFSSEENRAKIDRVILVLFLDVDKQIYDEIVKKYIGDTGIFQPAAGRAGDEKSDGDSKKGAKNSELGGSEDSKSRP